MIWWLAKLKRIDWKQLIVIGALALVVYQNFMTFEALKWVGLRTIPGMEQEYQDLREAHDLCEKGRTTLKDAIQRRNEEINEWVEKSAELEREHALLEEELEQLEEQTQDVVNSILDGKTPIDCPSAMEYLRDSAGDLQW